MNTTDSRVELSWAFDASPALNNVQRSRARRAFDGATVTVRVSERRSQLRNRVTARERLAALVAAAIAPPPPRRQATKPSLAARRRRVESKKQRGETKRLRGRPHDTD